LIDRITGPTLARRQRHPVPRPEQLQDVARQWRTELPELGRLDLHIDCGRKHLLIDELRIGASRFRGVGWDESEGGVTVLGLRLHVAVQVFDFTRVTLANISQHALARWHQRSFSATLDALRADVRELARAHDRFVDAEPGSDFTLSVRNGEWVGAITEIAERDTLNSRILNVRSFLA
jgi:hypothetical protein